VNKGDRLCGEQMTAQAVYNMVSAYAAQMGSTVAPHDIRRTFAQLARKADAPIERYNSRSATPASKRPSGIWGRGRT
jgi:hypothetical protein